MNLAGLEGAEWLEADGLGGFASGPVVGARTRRYHALLLAATTPPTGRRVLVAGAEVYVQTPNGRYAISTERYAPDVIHPDGQRRLVAFEPEPWPTWTYRLEDGTELRQEIFAVRGAPQTVMRFQLVGGKDARLEVRPFLAGRDYHSLHHQNPSFRFEPRITGDTVTFHPYDDVPVIVLRTNGTYAHAPDWYRHFTYSEESARGLDAVEDLAAPGVFSFELGGGEAWIVFGSPEAPSATGPELRAAEAARRSALASPLDRAAEAYLVRRGSGHTVVAGYPWFTDWGRDTFIALRGLCREGPRAEISRSILVEWASAISQGMVPNRFPDGDAEPEYNSVDASLWYVVAAHEHLQNNPRLEATARSALERAVVAIVDGYAQGTRFGIRADATDGLLFAGEPGVQLTWMDAKVGDYVVTPRSGKPVEIQALWINALMIASGIEPRFAALAERARGGFAQRFWNEARACLYDVLDPNSEPGVDATVRPNQIYAVGGLPYPVLSGDRARAVVDLVERELLTPLGLRSLSPHEPGYRPRYEGGVFERDTAYHQGTVWPFLIGPFVEAWLRTHGDTAENRKEARARFLDPLFAHLSHAGIGHVSEIADAEAPHTPRGCPFQAWSLGELLRASLLI